MNIAYQYWRAEGKKYEQLTFKTQPNRRAYKRATKNKQNEKVTVFFYDVNGGEAGDNRAMLSEKAANNGFFYRSALRGNAIGNFRPFMHGVRRTSSQLKVEIGREAISVDVEVEKVARGGQLLLAGYDFEHRRSFVDFVEHRVVDHVDPGRALE